MRTLFVSLPLLSDMGHERVGFGDAGSVHPFVAARRIDHERIHPSGTRLGRVGPWSPCIYIRGRIRKVASVCMGLENCVSLPE